VFEAFYSSAACLISIWYQSTIKLKRFRFFTYLLLDRVGIVVGVVAAQKSAILQ
jgi:hypothetical protein